MSTQQQNKSASQPVVKWLFLLYLVFVVYGSLVPLRYVDRSLDDAIQAFQHIPFLVLGVESRADWVANGVLYVPVGFLTAVLLTQTFRRIPRIFLFALAAAFSMALAVTVEFTQLYFPQRTVSLNDILAECIGSLLGLALAVRHASWFEALLKSFSSDPQRLKVLTLDGYAFAYLAFAMFPYDFLVSWPELAAKLDSNGWAWLLADRSSGFVLVSLQLAAEVVLTLPLGFLLARLASWRFANYKQAALIGLLLGGFIEVAQFFIASGVSQGLSVLTRAVGVCGGLALSRYGERWTRDQLTGLLRRYTPAIVPVYLLVLLEINGWFSFRWQGLEAAAAQLAQVNFMPFYYHYYTTEAIALFSLGVVSLSYLPIAVLTWAHGRAPGVALVVAALSAIGVESGKLFIQGAHPDPTNILLACAASWFTVAILRQVMPPDTLDCRVAGAPRNDETGYGPRPRNEANGRHCERSEAIHASHVTTSAARQSMPPLDRHVVPPRDDETGRHYERSAAIHVPLDRHVAGAPRNDETGHGLRPRDEANGRHCERSEAWKSTWLILCLAATGVWAITFPAFPVLVSLVLIAAAVMVWQRPVWVFAIIPAALPVFDLAPWSGRFFLDEFDALLLFCLALAYHRVPAPPRGRLRADAVFTLVAALVVLSFTISTLQGLRPFALPDANAFNNDYSPYNALRLAKGALWAWLVYGLSRRFVATGVDARRPFAWGMAIGLGLTVAVTVWERAAFSELWNFSDGYRVTGPFSATHTGGAYIDGFIAAALPFLLVLTLEKRHWLLRLAGLLLTLAATYALMVTFSRGGYLAFAVAVVIVLLAAVANTKTKRTARRGVMLAGLASAMLLVAVPVFKSEFAQSRLASSSTDLGFRQAHWADALAIRDPGWATSLFGMGLGRFPETKYWRSTLHPRAGTYQLKNEAGNTYLRLDAGDTIGVDQFVSLQPGQHYVLKLDVRPSRPDAKITVPICEKWLLTSGNCLAPTFDLGKEFGAWRSVEARFSATGLADSPWYRQRPIKLALTYATPQSTIDIDNVRLETDRGANLLRNGDFSQGLDHWFMATASTLHTHWRVHSLFYGVLFDQGWFGLVAVGAFIALALGRAAQKTWRGDALAGAALAALSGFLVGGVFDTQIDAPRFLLLLLLLAWACFYPLARPSPGDSKGDGNCRNTSSPSSRAKRGDPCHGGARRWIAALRSR